MKKAVALGLAFWLAASASGHAAPQGTMPFVLRLYQDEAASRGGNPLWWSYLSGRAKFLLDRVLRAEKAGREGLIDEDWLIQSQDSGGLKVTNVSLINKTGTGETAVVHYTFGGTRQNDIDWVKLTLIYHGTWKIEEITNSKGQTFTAAMEQALRH